MLVEAGTFTKVTSPTLTQSVPVGFQPKALIIWARWSVALLVTSRNK